MVKGFKNDFYDKFDTQKRKCLHRFATEFYSWFTEKGNFEPFRTHIAWTWGAVNLTNLILTSFSLLIEPLASPHIAEGR